MESKLKPRQDKFCIEFCKDFNAAAAARRAGYSHKTAYSIGWENLRKPEIKKRIAELLKNLSMEPDEIKKRLSDIARGDISDYLIQKTCEYTPKIKKSLKEIISDLENTIEFEENFAELAGFNATEQGDHAKYQAQRKRTLLRYELELKNNPTAFKIVNGETELVTYAELDVIAISKDKEKGKIKSFKQTREGIHVELYPADAALTNLARVHAMFIDKSEIDIKSRLEGLSESELDAVIDSVVNKLSDGN